MIKKIKQLVIITAMFALAMPAVILAELPPMPPVIVSGVVTIDGNIAPGATVSVAGVSAIVGGDGKYLIQIPSENIDSGVKYTYKVNNIDAVKQEIVGPTQEVNLSITTMAPTPPSGGVSPPGSYTPPDPPKNTPPKPPEMSRTPTIKGVLDITVVDGDIIQCASSSNPFAVYIVKIVGDTKYIRHIVSLEIFNYYGHLKWENLKQVDSLDEYSLSGWVRHNTGPNGTAGPTDKVYEINGDQTKHWINMTAEDFLSHGGSEPAIYSVNQGELDLYATGADVMSL